MTSRWRPGRVGRMEPFGHPVEVLAVIALGGVIGAEARYVLGSAVPHTAASWPWATLAVNAVGSVLIGVLMVVIVELREAHRLVRPFLGVGVLGGFTTFSTYAVDALLLADAGRAGVAVGYVVLTPLVAVLACAVGAMVTRVLAGRTIRRPSEVEP